MEQSFGKDKKISVIVPVYNAVKYLERCVGSLRKQFGGNGLLKDGSFGILELLLVDDGSTDGSGALCDRLASESDGIRVFHTQNEGVSAARNRGIEEAAGEYLTFVDADDWIMPDMLEHLLYFLESTGSDVAGCGFRECSKDAAEKGEEETPADGSPEILVGKSFIEQGLLRGDTRCWSKLYRRAAVGNIRFEKGLTIGEDMLFLLALARKNAAFCRSGYQGYCYFHNSLGAMNRQFKESYMDQISCWRKAAETIGAVAPELLSEVTAIRMTAVMLTAGKLALLSKKEREAYGKYEKECERELRECLSVSGAWRRLPAGYRVKTGLFRVWSGGYLWLYHLLKIKDGEG